MSFIPSLLGVKILGMVNSLSRNELKNLANLPEVVNGFYRKGSWKYRFKKRGLLLQSRFIYCIALEIFEALEPGDLILEINGIQIEFNEYSLIHILNRHYAKITKQYETGKTFHNTDFKPRILSVPQQELDL